MKGEIQKPELERVKGIEPSSSAWKAVALPLSYTREGSFTRRATAFTSRPDAPVFILGGGSWIRTNVDARSTDLQSAPFNHSGIPPKANSELCRLFLIMSTPPAPLMFSLTGGNPARVRAFLLCPAALSARRCALAPERRAGHRVSHGVGQPDQADAAPGKQGTGIRTRSVRQRSPRRSQRAGSGNNP